MIRFALAAMLACHFMLAGLSQQAFAVEDSTVKVPNEDAAMNAAIKKARQSLPQFWSKLASPGSDETGFSLKVRIDEGDIGEHFWLIDIERKGDVIFGTINNTPDEVKSVAMGQRIQIDPAHISDWMYMRNRKIVGNETMRALLPRMPKRQADAFRTMLETP